ncbi:MAG: hypothetical protein QOH06_6038 [Acidobacteriota bacterium]|nr:hypothetical protein [Acidobacteriota bacterium]
MRLARVPGVAHLTYGLSGTHRLARANTHAPVLEVGKDDVYVACPDPDVVSGKMGPIHLRRGEIRQAVHGGDDGPGNGAVESVTIDLVPIELSGEHPACPGAERVDLGDVKGIRL